MPGRLGGERITVQKLLVVKVDPERNMLLVRGAIPGPRRALITIKSSVKA
jgi:large subunit ribosomal protein L3